MNLSTEQAAKVDALIADFGDFSAQDRNTDRMHECFVVIRKELVEESVPLGHPALRENLDWIDRILDRIEAPRRKSTIQHIAARLSVLLPRSEYQIN
jgi:hypothetical protein